MNKTIFFVFVIVFSLLINVTVFGQRKNVDKQSQSSSKGSVVFNSVQAQTLGNGVLVQWQTGSEYKNLGFLVYRVTEKGRELISKTIVPGSYLKVRVADSDGGGYNFFDNAGNADSKYEIESLSDAGQNRVSASVSAETVSAFAPNAEQIANAQNPSTTNATFETSSLPSGTMTTVGAQTNLAAHRAVVGMTGGVKIGVRKEGVYRVSRAELLAAGFNVSSNVNNWQLFLNGIQQSIIVDSSGNYIEFYGKGVDTNESDTRSYYLVVGSAAGKRMGTAVARPMNAKVTANSYSQTFEHKERNIYVPGIFNGDLENYFGTIITSTATDDIFSLSGIDTASTANATLEITLQGLSTTDHQVDISINNNSLASITGNNLDSMTKSYSIPVSYLKEGNNTLKFADLPGLSLVNNFRITYNRKFAAQQNQLLFTTSNYKIAKLDGFTSSNIRVFDVSDTANSLRTTNFTLVQNGSTYGLTLPAYRAKTFFAVENSGLLTAASVTANNPSALATASHNSTFLVISHSNFMTQANAWATYRRNQGISSEVINIDDVFDEFNYGVASSLSIRSFLQYAKNNWQTPPQYVLFVGDASYDPRNYEGKGYFNFVPSKLVDTVYTETGSDETLADFDDDGLAEIAVGRIPARTTQFVTDALTKTQNFEASVAAAQSRGALFASDVPNGYDFQGVNERLAQQLPSSMPKVLINRGDANASTNLMSALNSGKFLVHYSGHGNASIWAATNFFGYGNVASLTNSSNLSVFTMLTCLNGYFVNNDNVNPNSESLSEGLLKTPNGGAVAVWSSSGLTTPDIQEVMGTRYYSQYTAGNILRLGDLIKDAKTTIPGGRDVRLSWNLLGDPMLKMH